MSNTLKQSFLINTTCKVNGFIYRLQKLPLIGKYFTDTLYGNEGILFLVKAIVLIFTVLMKLSKKILYLFIVIGLPFTMMEHGSSLDAIYILAILSFIGLFINNKMLEPNMKKYYAVPLLRMDAKDYALSHFYASLAELAISFLVVLPVLFLILGGNLFYTLPLIIFLIEIRIIGESINLMYYIKTKNYIAKKIFFSLLVTVILLFVAYYIPFMKIVIPSWSIIVAAIIFLIPALYALSYIQKKPNYKRIYKETITPESVIFDVVSSQNQAMMNQLKIHDQDLVIDDTIKNKNGYDYFNELFFARHKKILLSSAKKMALIFLCISLVIIVIALLFPDSHKVFQNVIMNYLPYFVFLMYVTSRGAIVTQAMFFNCDHSMLTYKFYKDPKTILEVFKKRLKTIVEINLIPGIVIAIALPVILLLAGGKSMLICLSLFLSIVFLAIFFSVHHLVIYYLLQPYDIEMKEKSSLYQIVNGITYFVCYICLQVNFPTGIFSIVIITLTGIYTILSLFLVYRYAPKTFKLKQ